MKCNCISKTAGAKHLMAMLLKIQECLHGTSCSLNPHTAVPLADVMHLKNSWNISSGLI